MYATLLMMMMMMMMRRQTRKLLSSWACVLQRINGSHVYALFEGGALK
jgi:hypothetical protein